MRDYVVPNWLVSNMRRLTAGDIAATEAVAPHGAVTGERCALAYMGTLDG